MPGAKAGQEKGERRRKQKPKNNLNLKVGQFSSNQKVNSQLPPDIFLDAMLLNVFVSAPQRGISGGGEKKNLKKEDQKILICHHDDSVNASMLT